jgi:pyruvate dehydrogenase E2 component (dihydrolipoamide acetyltransferase)
VPIEVNMAKISPTMESGQIVKWLVKVGDQVKEGDTLAEVQTDKAVMPMESFEEGVVARLDVAEGDEVEVGKRILVLAKKGEDAKQVAESLGGKAPAAAPTAAAAPKSAAPSAPPLNDRVEHVGAEVTNTPTRPELGPADGNGQSHQAPEPALATAASAGRIKSSPLARKIAEAANVDIRQVPPSGPAGRVVRRDVEAFLEHRPAAPAPAAPAARPAAAQRPAPATQRLPLNRMRTTIAQRMTEAKRNAPDIHVTVDIRVDQVVAARERLNQQLAAEKVKLSVGDFVTKAVALALRRHPGVNATFEDNTIVQHGEVNVGIAVAIEGGLIVPVLRNADALGLREIRTGSETLYQAARQMKLTADQMNGATFTISNLGMYGVRQFDAILNLPQVGILAVGAAEKRPVVVGDALGVGTVMTVTLTADHRAVDGAAAAEFLRTLKGLLEEPTSMLL